MESERKTSLEAKRSCIRLDVLRVRPWAVIINLVEIVTIIKIVHIPLLNPPQYLKCNEVYFPSIIFKMDSFQMENLWNYTSQFDNFQIFNTLSSTVHYQPLTEYEQIRPSHQVDDSLDFMSVFAGGSRCKNSLRLLSTEYLKPEETKEQETVNYFCMFSQNQNTNGKKYSLMPYSGKDNTLSKVDLALDQPSKVIVINNKFMVAVQKKCITLYRIHHQHLIIKDFDSAGIGNQFILVELQHLRYKNKDYLLVFGNEKEDIKPYFKCLVYELFDEKLRFIKKASLFQREHYKPIILFENYPGKEFTEEQFCMVLGGFSDYEQENYNFAALQIHLHLLVEQWVQYPIKLTNEILFNKKHTITSGKGVKVTTDISRDQFWLLFCTEYQTISKMDLTFGLHDDQFLVQSVELDTKTLKIRDEATGHFEPIYYAENTLYLVKVPENLLESKHQIPYRLYWCNKSMDKVHSRPLQDILRLFWQN